MNYFLLKEYNLLNDENYAKCILKTNQNSRKEN